MSSSPTRSVCDELKSYVQGVIGHFRNDARIDFWDVFNEPDNMNRPGLHQTGAGEQGGVLRWCCCSKLLPGRAR